ncbi:MAG: 3-oxoacyl-[acyl-carrier-protein] reductase [Candidatus Omnitrophica bacterium]|nr:3-oxoacyl-[acyl-carrier-protein] reductase [Candidatus Omnitrophota bacterium]
MNFEGKVVLVTGAAQGIGREIALSFAREKAKVVLFDLQEEKLASVQKELSSYSEIVYFAVDVTDLPKVEEAVNKIIDKFSRIDILVNNAGITRDNLILRLKEEDWDKVIAINLKGVFNCSKAVAKFMLKQRAGKIVNISSVIGIMGNAGQTNYGASKAGIIGFTKSLAKELGPRGICVNAVAPGYIQTAMTDKLPEEVKKKMLAMIPLGRFGKPEDIAAAVLFLASEASSYITGKVLTVDGGML